MSEPLVDVRCGGCGAPLPEGAMFCAECGRAVVPSVLAPAHAVERCDRCGGDILPDDIFCGECGHVAGSITRAYAAGRDTVVIEPVAIEAVAIEPVAPGAAPAHVRTDDARTPEAVRPADDVRSTLSERMRRPRERHRAESHEPAEAVAVDRPDAEADHADVEATRIVPPRGRGDRFVLQFSTGESVTVYGSGLIGRNPVPEPGEYFDQVVRVFDPTRSVSKTHLEFGQDAGSFWIRDRYSGNGTIVREPDSRPRRCDPGKRYPVMRGGRIDLGEQFLVVS